MNKALILAVALASSAMAATVTLTMDEVPYQPINGLAVVKGGVTFTFSNTAGNYYYNASNGGTLTYVQDPSLEGETSSAAGGGIGVTFSVPVYSVQFGIAESTMSPISPIATVSLYSSISTPFATIPFNSSLTDPWAEALFSYSGSTPITKILITPNTNVGAAAIDNLQINTAPISATPVPPSVLLVGLGVLALMFYVARRGFAFGS